MKRKWNWLRTKPKSKCLMAVFLPLLLALSPAESSAAAYAAGKGSPTELPNEDLKDGASESTAWKWIRARTSDNLPEGSYEPGGETWRFDLCGLRDGQSGYDKTGISSTFVGQGFTTWLGKGDKNGNPPSVMDGPGDRLYKYDGAHNGVVAVTGLGAELKLRLSTSPDNYYVYADYYVYNTEDKAVTYFLGTSAHGGVDGSYGKWLDGASSTYSTYRGITLSGGDVSSVEEKAHTSFEIITNDGSLGITPKPDFQYLGGFQTKSDIKALFDHIFNGYSDNGTGGNGISWGWKLNLKPHETAHRRVAFTIHPRTYYVENKASAQMDDVRTQRGTLGHPFGTMQQAVDKIGNHKGYIYALTRGPGFSGEYTDMNGPVILGGNSGQDITVAPALLQSVGSGSTPISAHPISFAESGVSPAIQVTGGGSLRLHDIVLTGLKPDEDHADPSRSFVPYTAPMISVTNGRLEIGAGTTIRDCRETDLSIGSAVDITGSSSLFLNRCTITGNTSLAGGKGAVHFAGSGDLRAEGAVTVKNNTIGTGETAVPANLYLEPGKLLTVTGRLEDQKPDGGMTEGAIGITTAVLPSVSPDGISTRLDQEIEVAKPAKGSTVDVSPCPFAENFSADRQTAFDFTTVGSQSLAEVPDLDPGHRRKVVLKRNGHSLNFVYRDQELQTPIPQPAGKPALPAFLALSPGEPINPPLSAPAIEHYTFADVSIDQGTFSSLVKNEYKTITGTMPDQDVTVYYDYVKVKASLVFVPNGGTPKPDPIEGLEGEPVPGRLPDISRYGYTFKGWNDRSDPSDPDRILTALPAQFPATPATYYAVFLPDHKIRFDYTVDYANQNGTIRFASQTRGAYWVTQPVTAQPEAIHGYRWSQTDSEIVPAQFHYTGDPQTASEPVGAFEPASGTFTGKMPAQSATVHYRYVVDDTLPDGQPNEAAASTLTIQYLSENGTRIQADDVTHPFPEAEIKAKPAAQYGFQCVKAEFTQGTDPSTAGGNLRSGAEGTFDGSYVLQNGRMPNQDVTIKYTYKPTDEGYPLTVDYLDNGSKDEALRHIVNPPLVQTHHAEDPVGAAGSPALSYEAPYGYDLHERQLTPDHGSITWAEQGNDFTGRMPGESATITYSFNRDPSKWTDLTYETGVHGARLMGAEDSADVSPDVTQPAGAADGSAYTVQILKQSESHAGWTLQEMKEKRLIPVPQPESKYYQFGGWFIDTNGNKTLDPDRGETLLAGMEQFSGNTTLTAYFKETPGLWIDITLASGGHGTIGTGRDETIHTAWDTTWGGIQNKLPTQFTPEPHYSADPQGRWYLGDSDIVMTPDMKLKNNQTYTVRFLPDPGIFGTDAETPDAQPGINSQGEGKITVYTAYGIDTAHLFYQYILTGPQGQVLAVQPGNPTGRLQFDHLYPGTRYEVYEAATKRAIRVDRPLKDSIDPADPANDSSLSQPAEVLTPAVETNYRISYDEAQDGKTVLTISPADKDSDYAVLDDRGAVLTPGQESGGGFKHPAGTPAAVRFKGLSYNKEYTIVARPEGMTSVTAESKREDGTVILTDLGAEPELKTCILETLEGSLEQVGDESQPEETGRCDTVRQGDKIIVNAPAVTGDNRPFRRWEVLIGPDKGVEGLNLSKRTAAFSMPATNVVLHAVYEPAAASPSNAQVKGEVRGGKKDRLLCRLSVFRIWREP